MPKYAVHYVWIDLCAGNDYGSRASSVYPKVMKGLATSTPVGVWTEHGSFEYLDDHRPDTEELRVWRLSLAKLGLDEWVKQQDERHGTWSDGWAVMESDLSADLLLESLHFEFLAAHPPVNDIAASTHVLEVGDGGDDTSGDLDDDDEPDDEGAADEFQPSMRFVNAQSWSIAAELVRRHPELIIHEMHPAGGMYDCLALLRPETHEPFIQLNRVGSIQVGADPGFRLTWPEVMSAPSPHAVVEEIEVAADLHPPTEAPPSTPRVLAYQFIAAALAATVNDEHVWDARNEFIDSSGDWWPNDPEVNGYLADFSEARGDLDSTPRVGLWHEPESHFWALLRDDKPLALVSIEGRVYLRHRRLELLDEHERYGQLLSTVFGTLLGESLR